METETTAGAQTIVVVVDAANTAEPREISETITEGEHEKSDTLSAG